MGLFLVSSIKSRMSSSITRDVGIPIMMQNSLNCLNKFLSRYRLIGPRSASVAFLMTLVQSMHISLNILGSLIYSIFYIEFYNMFDIIKPGDAS